MKIFEADLRKEDMQGQVLEVGKTVIGMVTKCTKDIEALVDLGDGNKGICEADEIEVLLGNKDKTKKIASLDRVGKYSYFKVIGLEDGTYKLSRKAVQEEYYNKEILGSEYNKVFDGRVLRIMNYGLFIDIGFGITGILGLSNFTQIKTVNPQESLKGIKQVKVFVKELDGYKISLGHKELLGDFKEQIKDFEVGGTYIGTIRSTNEYGIFVELASNLTGLADKNESVQDGDIVSVYVKNILYDEKRVKLRVVSVLDHKEPWYRELNLKYIDTKSIPRDWEF